MRSIVHSRQSLLDIMLQECGSIEHILTVAERNDISITEDLRAGQQLEIAQNDIAQQQVVNIFSVRRIKPATALATTTTDIVSGGIGYMAIEIDFKVI